MLTELSLPVEINPASSAKATVILLHGLGADGYDFVDLIPQLRLPKDPAIRFILPHAPLRPITLNNGYMMRAWYDIKALERTVIEDEAGIRDSEQLLGRLIQKEQERGIAADRIVLAGFSQGGAIVLQTGLRYPQKLAGILALSTYLPLAKTLAAEVSAVNKNCPIFLAHGETDSLIPMAWAQTTYQQLIDQGYSVAFHRYPMEHSVCQREVEDMAAWLVKVLS